MNELLMENRDYQTFYRVQQQVLEEEQEDLLCFNDIFGDNLAFGIILCLVVLISTLLFFWLMYYWYQRKSWFPIKERSTYCTLFFLIASGISYFIQPIILIVYNLSDDLYYIVDGSTETIFKAFYITSRFCMTTLYISKVSRLVYAFRVRSVNFVYRFFQRELFLIIAAISVSLAICIPLIFSNQTSNIVLPIEKGYTANVQQFWIPVQCIETIVYLTLFYFMKDVTPIYRMNRELFILISSNFVLSIISYSLYARFSDLHNYCHNSTDFATYIVFASNQLRTLINVIFCVYLPLRQAVEKPIPLPNEKLLLDTKGDNNEVQNFYVVLFLYKDEVLEPLRNFLKHMDLQIQTNSKQGQDYLVKLQLLSNKYPQIQNIKSFEKLLECFEEISYEQEYGDQVSMQQIVSQYIVDPIQLQTFIQNNHEHHNQSHNQISTLNDHSHNTIQLFIQSNIENNIIANNFDQNNQIINQTRRSFQSPFYKKLFSICKSKKKNQQHQIQIFNLLEYETQKVIEESFANQNNIQINSNETLKRSLQKVTDELFAYIHIIWKDFFYLTKSFESLRDTFQRYGSISNHLQAFELVSEIKE